MDLITNNGKRIHFIDTITDLGNVMGVSHLEDMSVAIDYAEYYQHPDIADWFKRAKKRLDYAVKTEWSVENG